MVPDIDAARRQGDSFAALFGLSACLGTPGCVSAAAAPLQRAAKCPLLFIFCCFAPRFSSTTMHGNMAAGGRTSNLQSALCLLVAPQSFQACSKNLFGILII